MQSPGEESSLTKKGKNEKNIKNEVTNKLPENASKAFELFLYQCGDYHKYQWRLTFVSGYTGLFSAMQVLSAAFLAATPEFFCDVPYLNDKNLTYIQSVTNVTVPWVRGKEGNLEPSKCQYYEYDFSSEPIQSLSYYNDSFYEGLDKKDCRAWVYSGDVFQSTVVTEWQLVCDRRWLMSTAQSTYMLGMFLGSLIFSALSDKIGRRPASLISCVLFIITSIAVAFSNSFVMFILLRVVVAGTGYAMGLCTYVLLLETVSLKGRNIMGNLSGIFFVLGFFCLTLLAYFIRDWRYLQLAMSVPSVTLLSFFWLLPESSRWLLMEGREEEGLNLLKSIANYNQKPFPSEEETESLLKLIRKEAQKRVTKTKLTDKVKSLYTMLATLFRTPNMRRRNLISCYTWLVVSMTYYGLTFSGANLNVSPYLSIAISSFAEIPAMAGLIILLLFFGRRTIYCASFLLGGLSCLSIMFVPTHMVGWNMALSTIGKFGTSIAFGAAYIVSAELVPTHVRNMALGMASMSARIGSGVSPYIVDLLGEVYYVIPFTIFGALAIIASLLALLLPETGDKCLPESIEEIEAMPR